jgi:hypothetical protein
MVDTIYIFYNSFWYISSWEEIYSSGIKKWLIWMLVIFLSYSIVKWVNNLEAEY